ncbi:hypothetical protein P692DRAFT_20757908 [Suillus brevipes Sb2]|nr:hypothetical protein P692DRAFT_20757908 [Suillus brevipes Sb2]
MNIHSASSSSASSSIIVEDVQVTHSTSTQTNPPFAAIYKENVATANEEALIESAILSLQHALEIERVLVERNAYPTAAVCNVIRTAQLIEQEATLITQPDVKQSILHYQGRIRRLCYLLLPSNIKGDILQAIQVVHERTTTEVARPPSPHCLDEYIRIPSTSPSETPKPILPPATPRITIEDQATVSPSDLESGTKTSPIVVSDDSTPPSPNARVARREQKRRLRISAKSTSPIKTTVKVSPTTSLPARTPVNPDYNFICRHCKVISHRHRNCAKYWCRVCYKNAPGHLSTFCKKLPVREKQDAPLSTTRLAIWEANVDEEEVVAWEKEHEEDQAEFEERFPSDFSDDPIYYYNQDN